MSDNYYAVNGEFENTTVIERSKFICYLKGVENEEDAKAFVERIKKKNSLATHNCYAYIADEKGLIAKFSDDGEPQGTAGLPMLEVLKNKKLYKTAAVVTRYFGGIKLGTGGLTRAYSGSVIDCVNIAEKRHMKRADFIRISLDYDGYSKILKLLNENVMAISTEFDQKISMEIAVAVELSEQFIKDLNDAFCGNAIIEKLKNGFFGFDK